MFEQIGGEVGILWVLFSIVIGVFSIIVFVFWILMLVDCVKRKFKKDTEKIVWVLVIIFAGIIGALIYYFIVRTKNKKK